MEKITLQVTGMHCKSCEMLITDALIEVGAATVQADYKTGKVKVEFDGKKLSLPKIKGIIQKEGYKAE